jgi:hypothetical protein
MANQSDVKDGNLVQHHYPDNFYAGFQELEYLHEFIPAFEASALLLPFSLSTTNNLEYNGFVDL